MIQFSSRCIQYLKNMVRGVDDVMNNPSLNKEDAARAVTETFVDAIQTPGIRQQFASLVRNNYLSGIATFARNVIGNTVRFLELPLARIASGRFVEAYDIFRGYGHAFQTVFPRFMRGIRDHTVEVDGRTLPKYEFWLQSPGRTPEDLLEPGIATKAANMLLAFPSKLQRGVDDSYSALFEHAQLEVMLSRIQRGAKDNEYSRAFLAKRGVTPEQFIDEVRTSLKHSKANDRVFETLAKVAPDLATEIEEFARYGTFRSKLGTSMIDKGTKAMAGAVKEIPELSLVMPFIVTPTNIAKFGAGYVPGVGLLRFRQGMKDIKLLEADIAKLNDKLLKAKTPRASEKIMDLISKKEGEIQFKRDLNRDIVGQQLLGIGMMSWAWGSVQGGMLTGAMPSDPAERAKWIAAKKPEFSFKVDVPGVGERWISYAGMEPIQTVLGLVAGSFEAAQKARREGKDLTEMGKDIADIVRGAFLDKTFTQSLSDMMLAMQDPNRLPNFLVGMTNGFTPSFMNAIANLEDPIKREIRDPNLSTWIINNLKAKVPVLRKELPAQSTITGEDRMTQPSGVLTGINVQKVEDTAVTRVLNNPELSISPPDRKIGSIDLDGATYAEMSREMGTYTQQIMSSLGNNPGFLALPDSFKAKMVENAVSEMRKAVRQKYLVQLIGNDPEAYRKAVADMYRKQGINPYTSGVLPPQ